MRVSALPVAVRPISPASRAPAKRSSRHTTLAQGRRKSHRPRFPRKSAVVSCTLVTRDMREEVGDREGDQKLAAARTRRAAAVSITIVRSSPASRSSGATTRRYAMVASRGWCRSLSQPKALRCISREFSRRFTVRTSPRDARINDRAHSSRVRRRSARSMRVLIRVPSSASIAPLIPGESCRCSWSTSRALRASRAFAARPTSAAGAQCVRRPP